VLEDLLVHEEDGWSSDEEKDHIDDESDKEVEDWKKKKNQPSEMNDDVG